MYPKITLIVIAMCFNFIVTQNTLAGSLDSFEQSAIKDSGSSNHRSSNSSTDCESENSVSDCIGYYIARFIVETMFSIMHRGGYESLALVNERVNVQYNNMLIDEALTYSENHGTEEDEQYLKADMREVGQPFVPHLRLDASYQYIDSNLSAKDFRLALGYGPLALQINQTQFEESNPQDSLDLTRLYATYRMTFGAAQLGIGIGSMTISGNKTTRKFYMTAPLHLHIPRIAGQEMGAPWMGRIGIEFKPAWSDQVSDYDLGLFYRFKYVATKVGYRWLSAGDNSLNGPYAGIAIFY